MTEKRVYRSRNALIGGVCAGIAEAVDADALVMRIFAVLLALVTVGLAVFLYAYLWAKLPIEEEGPEPFEVMPESAESSAYGAIPYKGGSSSIATQPSGGLSIFSRLVVAAALMLLFLAVSINVSPLVPGAQWWQFWPIAFVIMGLCLIIVPVPGEHEAIWHALGIVVMSASAMILPMVLRIASWSVLLNALVILWPLLVVATILFVAGIHLHQTPPIVFAAIVVAAFCLMTLFLFASTDVTKVMTLLSHSGRVFIGS